MCEAWSAVQDDEGPASRAGFEVAVDLVPCFAGFPCGRVVEGGFASCYFGCHDTS